MSEEEMQAFLSYQIVVRDIGKVEDGTIREIFRRINLTKFQLEEVEIHNAVYNGQFIQVAKEVLNNIDLSEFGVFHESEFTRMAELHFILLIMATVENTGYFPEDKEIENFIAKFNDEYPIKNHIKALIIKIFTIIKDLNLPADSIWFRKSNFFTLVAEIAIHNATVPDNLRELLIQLEGKLIDNKNKDNEFRKYYRYMCAGTNSRAARVERADIFNKYIYGSP